MAYPRVLSDLINSFKKLPGVGEKSAERLALSILDFSEEEVKNFYTGEFLIPVAKEFIKIEKERANNIRDSWKGEYDNEQLQYISKYARLTMLEKQKALLENFHTHFDNFYSELTLHQSGKVEACIKKLQELGVLYEQDGAVWFKTSKYGDEKDRVIKKSGNHLIF